MASIPKDIKASYNFLGKSGLRVSNLCLGCMNFGKSLRGTPGQCDEDLSHQIINRYVEWGGNFLDTADIYGKGMSEEIVGKWLVSQERDNFVIASKCCINMGNETNANNVGLSRRHITASIDGSLRRLQTHYLDLYQGHIWDFGTPVEETLRTLDDLVRAGKVRYVGFCNLKGWQVQRLIQVAEKLGIDPIVSLQQQYSLASRMSECEAFEVCKLNGIGVLPWSPLKGGLLSGKVKRGEKPREGRLGWVAENESRGCEISPAWSTISDHTFQLIEAAESIGKKHGRTTAQVSLRWLLQRDVVSSVVMGARTLSQLDDNMGASSGWALSKEEMQELDELSALPWSYPYTKEPPLFSNRTNLLVGDPEVKST